MELKPEVMEDLQKFVFTFTNEKGNIMVSERNKQRTTAIQTLARLVGADFADAMVVTKDGVAVPLGIDRATEEVIWAHIDITINMKEPEPAAAKPTNKKKMF